MIIQGKRWLSFMFLLASTGSFALADIYQIDTSWHTGSARFGNLVTYTGDGTFTWNGTNFSNASFSFVETSPTSHTVWTANPSNVGPEGLFDLVIGSGAFDCIGGFNPSCIGIVLDKNLTLNMGSPDTITFAFTLNPSTTFDSGEITDLTAGGGGGGSVSSVPEPGSIALLLTALTGLAFIGRRRILA